MTGFRTIAGAALLLVLPSTGPSAQEPTLADVLARASDYVGQFQRQLSGIVAEERYIQDVRPGSTGVGGGSRTAIPVMHRELKSDLLLVRPDGVDRWIQFRDVFDVDGVLVRDRDERLMTLFITPTGSTATQVQRIADESSRYNIGNLHRTVNVPVLALAILEQRNQDRFRFRRRENRARPQLARGDAQRWNAGWIVEFNEVEPKTIIRTTSGRDMPVHGKFWVDAASGQVIASEIVAEDTSIRGMIDVEYQREPAIGLMVPVEMREHYDIRRDNSRVDGVATYSRFRQFQVKVDEKIAPIKEKDK